MDRLSLPENTLLDDNYRIERVIGTGGFGITYEAEDVRLKARVAIKEYCPEEFGYRDASLSVRPKSERQRQKPSSGGVPASSRKHARSRGSGIQASSASRASLKPFRPPTW
jgi:serine/threonine protein kinase